MEVLTGPRKPIRQVSLSGCGRWVGTFRGDLDAGLYDRASRKWVYRTDDSAAYGAAVHPAGDLFLVWGGEGLLAVATATLAGRPAEPNRFTPAVAAAGGRLVGETKNFDGFGYTGWELAGGRPRETWRLPRRGTVTNGPLVAAPAGDWFAVRAVLNRALTRIEVRGTADGTLRSKRRSLPEEVLLAVTDSGAVVVGVGGRVSVADPAARAEPTAAELPGRGPVTAAVSPAGDRLLAARDRAVCLLAAETLAVLQTYTVPTAGMPTCVAFAPDGLTAACGTSKGEVVVWDVG